jgi:hypothetical protein
MKTLHIPHLFTYIKPNIIFIIFYNNCTNLSSLVLEVCSPTLMLSQNIFFSRIEDMCFLNIDGKIALF